MVIIRAGLRVPNYAVEIYPPSPLDIVRPNHGRRPRIRVGGKRKKLLPRHICSKGHRAIVGQSLGHNSASIVA